MTTQRVLILGPDAAGIEGMVKAPSLQGVHFSFLPDWQSGSTALRKENFSAIVAQNPPPARTVYSTSLAVKPCSLLP